MVAIIDTHHHLWDLERLELPWVSSIPQLNRSFRMPDYLTAVHDQAIAATVYMEVNVVEAQHQQEIDYVTALCEDADNPMQGAAAAIGPTGPPGSAGAVGPIGPPGPVGSEFWDGSIDGDIHNTNSGNVGIGTNSPAANLEVSGSTGIIVKANPLVSGILPEPVDG